MAEGQVGPYRILERLGAGAHGVVFLAEDTRLHRRVALKTVAGTAGSEAAEVRRRLLREARAAARLNHPNIAAVYDVCESDEGVHIVMEYVPGATLAARVRSGPLPPMQVLDIALQLSGALAHAHELGVVHRDLKPANVMMAPSGQAKILDFGVAHVRVLDADSQALARSDLTATDSRRVVGTPPYMPPELLRGEGHDARSDVYSLGVTLFELLTGRRPFEARDGMALTAAILTAPTPRPRSVARGVPAVLDEAVYRAMARDANARYHSAAELCRVLKGAAADISDPPTAGRPPLASGKRRRGWVALAAVAGLIALFAAVAPVRRTWSVPAVQTSAVAGPTVVAVLPLAGASGDPQMESFAAGAADALITTLSKLPDVSVVSRAASLKYAARKQELDAIARELGATLLVDGAVQRSGARLRVTLSMVDPRTRVVRWQQAYDGTYEEIFTFQRDVAAAVANELRLRPSAAREVDAPVTASVEALADYSQARSFLERPDVADHLDHSIRLFKSAIARDRRFARAHAGLGEAYWRKYQATRQEEWSIQARDSISEALRLQPDEASVRLSLAAIYRSRGLVEDAIEELRRVVVTQPLSDDAHRQLGQALLDTGRRAEGLASIQEAIRLRPNYWGHHYTLGVAHYSVGKYQDALPCFGRVVELQPDSPWGFNMLGSAYWALSDTAKAIPNYEQAIKLGHANASANLGTIHFTEGRLPEAIRAYAQALQRNPGSPVTHHNLGDAYWASGDRVGAEQQYRQAVELGHAQVRVNPRDAATLVTLAVVQAKLGRHAGAEADIDRAMEFAPESADVWHGRATIHQLTGRTREAGEALDRAIAYGYSTQRLAADPWLRSIYGSANRLARSEEARP